jgi:hypothetical protein
MPAGNELLFDLFLRRAEIAFGVEDLFACGDVVGFAGEQVDGTGDVLDPSSTVKRFGGGLSI